MRGLVVHLDTTFRGWSATLSARFRVVVSRLVLVSVRVLDFHGRIRVVNTMFIPAALQGMYRKPPVPNETPGPMPLIRSHESVKLKIFTHFNRKSIGTFPEKVPITNQHHRKSDRPKENPHSLFGTISPRTFAREKTIPNASKHNTTKRYLISFSNVRRVEKLLRTPQYPQGCHHEDPRGRKG